MTNGLLIYGEIFAHFLIHCEALPHIWLCNCSTLNFIILFMRKILFSFLSVCNNIQQPHKLSITIGDCKTVNRFVGIRGSQRDVVYLDWPTCSALVYEPKCGGGGVVGSQPMSTAVHMELKINFGDLTPYLIYGWYVLKFIKREIINSICNTGHINFRFTYLTPFVILVVSLSVVAEQFYWLATNMFGRIYVFYN